MAKRKSEKTTAPAIDRDWEAENDLHHLQKSEEIMRDKERHKRAMSVAHKRMSEMQAVVSRGRSGHDGRGPKGGKSRQSLRSRLMGKPI